MDKITTLLQSDRLPPALFGTLVELAPIAVCITDRSGQILYVNPAFCRTTGYSLQEVIGYNPSMLSYKVTPRAIYDDLWGKIAQGQSWSGRLVNRRRDGSRYLAELSITPLLDEHGHIAYFLGLHQDVTELHALTERLQNKQRLIESIIDLAPVAVALLDEQERVVLDNQEYKKLMGRFGSREPAEAMLTALRAECGDAGWQVLRQQEQFEQRVLRFDNAGAHGPNWYALSGSWFVQGDAHVDRFFDSDGRRYLLLVITDHTQLKRQQQSEWLQTLRTMLADGEMTARLRETLSGAAYQLAGPLNVIGAVEKRLEQRLPAGDPATDALRQAREQGEAALALLKEATPAMPVEAWQPVNCNELLHDVLLLETRRLLAEGITVDWKPALRLSPVEAQAVALRSALSQLLGNAIEALHDSHAPLREIRLASQETDDWVELEISDSGPGIPEELRHKVFEPFFTTRPGGARAGMGLTLAQEVTQRHQGILEIDPHYPAGCRIVLRLPKTLKVHHD